MFDIGVNLTSSQFGPDLGAVMQRASAAGVTGMAITGTSVPDSLEAVELCRRYHSGFAGILCSTAGIHPHHAADWSPAADHEIRTLATQPEVLAIGETGLDFNRNFAPRDKQIAAFEAQLTIAASTNLPVFLHEREAFDTQIEILRTHRDHISDAVAHCFTGTGDQLQAYLDLDFYIGITGWVCDERRGQELASIASGIPLDRLLIETDAPWLLPRNMQPPANGRRNEPAYLTWIARKLAELYNTSELEIRERTFENALRFFRISVTTEVP